ncbi:WD40 domain-containing protein [Coleofasciculus chthonoplastes]|nr:PD40 domain-containing protein [Coleofasciculus chthonoplastes]
MTHTPQPDDSIADNQTSLNALVRSLRLSQGQFRLILVRCNYGELRQRMVQRLREVSSVPIRELVLPESVESLYGFIKTELADEKPQAVIVLGLESVKNLTGVFKSSNYIREELSHNFSFPLILWMNDPVWQRLIRVAPDLESWATTVEFQWTTAELLEFLTQETEKFFRADLTVSLDNYEEIELAWTALQKRGQAIAPELAANLEFVRGFNDFKHHRFDEALSHYQTCRDVLIDAHTEELERQGILLLHIALCYSRKAEQNSGKDEHNLRISQEYFQDSIQEFIDAQRLDLIAPTIHHFAEVLRQLQDWDDLRHLAESAQRLHQQYGTSLQVAQDYGILAEVALKQSRWQWAKPLAQEALTILNQSPERHPREQGFYRFILASACQSLGEIKAAIAHLEQGIEGNQPDYDPPLYIKSLAMLRSLYFEQGSYRKAFELKQNKRSIEYQYGFQAFAGASHLQAKKQLINVADTSRYQQAIIAQEIAASGREKFIKELIKRICRTDQKLTIIHGQSGVGKSSIIQAGLVPALRQQLIGEREAFPVVLRVYTNWVETLGSGLAEALGKTLNSTAAIIQQLRTNADCNRVTVLIFDQFEEFFFIAKDQGKRQEFYRFLADCLDIPFVKLILSLREDYLHYLLECNRLNYLGAIDHNILDKDILCYLGNFTPDEARLVIERLTQRSQFYLEPGLITELVKDLAVELNSVRPIELQIVGAQLQDENITKLEQYRGLGDNPKEVLVNHYLEGVIKDCGQENDEITRLVLYWLTDENLTRPLKTRSELSKDLDTVGLQVKESQLYDLVLPILVGSGLVVRIPESPDNRYQLVHDYLVSFIRQNQTTELLEELNREKEQRQIGEQRFNQFIKIALVGSVMAVFGLAGLTWQAESQRRRAEKLQIGQSDSLSRYSEELFNQDKIFDALIAGLQAGIPLQQISEKQVNFATKVRVANVLWQAVNKLKPYNSLEEHDSSVNSVSFSPDGKILASGSEDKTIKLWNLETGEAIATLDEHDSSVISVSFSPDGKTLASGSEDKTIKLWNLETGEAIATLDEHDSWVNSVSFSPDGKTLASGSEDKTIKLWNLETGEAIATLDEHDSSVISVSFSPDGKTLASGSGDNTIKLWNLETGKAISTLTGHDSGVISVSFSPDGKTLASGSGDNTIKLWNLETGEVIATLTRYNLWVNSVSFSPDGKTLAFGSDDNTIKLWNLETGEVIATLIGHNSGVISVNFSPDGKILASGSGDNTIKLWNRETGEAIATLTGHYFSVNSVSFSPDGKILASGSGDNTIKLWNRETGETIDTLTIYNLWVNSASFSPDGKTLASGNEDKTIKLWNLETGEAIATITGHDSGVISVSFSPDGKILASGSGDNTIKLWNLETGKNIDTLYGHDSSVNSVSFSPDGKTLASGSDDYTIKLWNIKTGENIDTLYGHDSSVNSVSFSPDGKILASGSGDNTIKLWNIETGEAIDSLTGHYSSVNSVSFSPDGKTLASGSEDNTIKLWNIKTGKNIDTLYGHYSSVNSVSFSPDGKTLASGSDDNKIKLWNLDLDNLLVRGCNWVRDYLKTNPNVSESDRALCDGIYN